MSLVNLWDYDYKLANTSISSHSLGNNEGALAFYRRHGFEVVDTKEEYYKRIQPANAHVLEKRLDGSSVAKAKVVEGINGDVRED